MRVDWAERLAARPSSALLPLAVPMARAVEAFDRPLLVAVMGEFNAGKSSFVNALAGTPIAPVGVTPTTATINVLRHGDGGGRVIYHDGTTRDLHASAVASFSAISAKVTPRHPASRDLRPLEALRRVESWTPLPQLVAPGHERRRGTPVGADAIVWIFAAGQARRPPSAKR